MRLTRRQGCNTDNRLTRMDAATEGSSRPLIQTRPRTIPRDSAMIWALLKACRAPDEALFALWRENFWVLGVPRGGLFPRVRSFTQRKPNGTRWMWCRLCPGPPPRPPESLEVRIAR